MTTAGVGSSVSADWKILKDPTPNKNATRTLSSPKKLLSPVAILGIRNRHKAVPGRCGPCKLAQLPPEILTGETV